MNIIDPEVKFNPNTMKLIHCNSCDKTWAAKKIPAVCPHCGAKKGKNGVGSASEDECMSWGEEYTELLAKQVEVSEDTSEESSDDEYNGASDYSNYGDYPDIAEYQESTDSDGSISQDTGDYEETGDEFYEPIGYDPDELANSMNGKKRVSRFIQKELLSDAERSIKEAKWSLQRAGLPTDAIQTILPEIKNKADNLGAYIPLYTSFMLKVTVDNTLQRELRHPKKGRRYSISDVNKMLEELDISENYWESYYDVAGIAM